MTARHAVDTITSDELDQLYAERDQYFHFACAARGASGAPSFPDLTDTILALVDRAEQAEAAIERVRLLADRWDNALAPDQRYARALRAALDQAQQPTT